MGRRRDARAGLQGAGTLALTPRPARAALPYLPVQTVLDTFTIGEPTELPYSVQEPS